MSSGAATVDRRRAAWQVLVVPFRYLPSLRTDGERRRSEEEIASTGVDDRVGIEVAVFHRADMDAWQFIAGGGEEGEAPTDAASREALEEAGIPPTRTLISLSSVGSIPVEHFSGRSHWPPGLTHIPEYSFAVDCTDLELMLSAEHRGLRWVDPAQASGLLTWDSNRQALKELVETI